MSTLTEGDSAFLSIMPPVLRHAEFAFRHTKDPRTYDDRVQETLCLCWLWTCRLWEQGKDARAFPTALARFATRHVKSGRSFVGGKAGRNDALSPLAHADPRLHRPVAARAPEHRLARAVDGAARGPARQPRARSWPPSASTSPPGSGGSPARDRGMAEEMAVGRRRGTCASRFRVSPGRISQKRRDFREDWRRLRACPA